MDSALSYHGFIPGTGLRHNIHLQHFLARAQDSGDWSESVITEAQLKALLKTKIDTVDVSRIKADIIRFIPNPKILDLWSAKYFHDVVVHLKVAQ